MAKRRKRHGGRLASGGKSASSGRPVSGGKLAGNDRDAKDARAVRQWLALGVLAVAAIGGVVWWSVSPSGRGEVVAVTVPKLSDLGRKGAVAFAANCAVCHGQNAAGSGKAPPLIHPTYRPEHHADSAIFRAMSQGVEAHHWRFGDMPPQRQVTREQAVAIVAYLREVQRANGIR